MKALGNRKNYKTEQRGAIKNLKRHKELMDKYIVEGLPREEASSKAFKDITGFNFK